MTLVVSAPVAARNLIRHQQLTAYVSDDFACEKRIVLGVRSKSKGAFAGQRRGLQRLLGGARAALKFECSDVSVETIVMVGSVGKNVVWKGFAAESNDWVLQDLPLNGGRAGGGKSKSAKRSSGAGAGAPIAKSVVISTVPIATFDGGVLSFERSAVRTSGYGVLP